MRKRLTAVILAVLVFSLIAASAASLGGITSAEVGAESSVIASCTTAGIDVDYDVSYSATADEYEITQVNVTVGDAGCDGEPISVTLEGTTGATETQTGSVSGTTAGVGTFSFSANDAVNVAVVIG